MIQEIGSQLMAQLTGWKVLAAFGGSVVITAIAFVVLVWVDYRQSKS